NTRLQGDWSSDVCSSDLDGDREVVGKSLHHADDRQTLPVNAQRLAHNLSVAVIKLLPQVITKDSRGSRSHFVIIRREIPAQHREIGRATCRARAMNRGKN